MGWNDRIDDDDDLGNLPPEAFGNIFDTDGPFDPANQWLRTASEEEQLLAMRAWFLARFCDPADDTPYNSREGGYLFIHGGPHDPGNELFGRFSGLVSDDLIQEVIDEMHAKVGDEWAPIHHDHPDDYDDRFDLLIVAHNEPLRKLQERLRQAKQVLSLQGDPAAQTLAQKLVFSAAISALEAFLYETAHYWVENDNQTLRDIVTKLPVFRDEQIRLGDLFKRQEGLRDHVKGYLQNLVWHRWDKVGPLFRNGLGIELPSMQSFDAALIKRHDIIHRSGHTKDGAMITVDLDEIQQLCSAVERFAIEVDARLAGKASSGK